MLMHTVFLFQEERMPISDTIYIVLETADGRLTLDGSLSGFRILVQLLQAGGRSAAEAATGEALVAGGVS